MIVRLYRNHLDYFKRKCKKSKNEEYAVLVGYRISPTVVEIHKWRYPKLAVKTPDAIQTTPGALVTIVEFAKEHGMVIVGDIHSHIDEDSAMSRTDFLDHKKHNHCITGILGTIRKTSQVSFWEIDSPLKASLQYIKRE